MDVSPQSLRAEGLSDEEIVQRLMAEYGMSERLAWEALSAAFEGGDRQPPDEDRTPPPEEPQSAS